MKLFYCCIAILLIVINFLFADDKVVNNYHPQFSADGKSIYFLSDRSGKEEKYLLDLDKKNISRVDEFPSMGDLSNVAIVDGKLFVNGREFSLPLIIKEINNQNSKMIYFVALPIDGGNLDIYRVDYLNIDCSQLTNSPAVETNLTVYDGLLVCNTNQFGKGQELCLIDEHTGEILRLTYGSEINIAPLIGEEAEKIKRQKNAARTQGAFWNFILNGTINFEY